MFGPQNYFGGNFAINFMSACVVGKNIPHLVHPPASAHCTLAHTFLQVHTAHSPATVHCTVHTLLQVHTAHLQSVEKSHFWFRFHLQAVIFYFLHHWMMLSFVLQVNMKVIFSVNCFQVNEITKCPKQASRKWLNLSPINVWFLISPILRCDKRQEHKNHSECKGW